MQIAVFGLGKLGSVLASLHAAKGHTVVGVDLSAAFVDSVNNGQAPVEEPGLQALFDQSAGRLTATTDAAEALKGAEASYVIVPTPSDANGVFSNKHLVNALRQIGQSLADHDDPHTVVITSTVMPGSSDRELRAALEETSGRKVGDGIGLVYSPEFIALGSVVRDMKFPDVILIGESDARAGDLVVANARTVVENEPAIRRMTLVNAEIVKIAINTFVTTKISYANMLAEICDKMPGADVDVVTAAVGADSRVGSKYLKGALGYGGPCFPRDNIALSRFGDSLGVDASIAKATDAINDRQVGRIVKIATDLTPAGSNISILGLAYKPDTPTCERSQGIGIANELADAGYVVTVHDPLALDTAQSALKPGITSAADSSAAISAAATVIIATAWPQYANLGEAALAGKSVIDCWGIVPDNMVQPAQLHRPGKLRANEKETDRA